MATKKKTAKKKTPKKTTKAAKKKTAKKKTPKKTTKAAKKKTAKKKTRRPRQTEVAGSRPAADEEIDAKIEELDAARNERLIAGKAEKQASNELVALFEGKGLLRGRTEYRYPMSDGDTLVVRPKNMKLGCYIEPAEKAEEEPRQTKLTVVEDGLNSVDEDPEF